MHRVFLSPSHARLEDQRQRGNGRFHSHHSQLRHLYRGSSHQNSLHTHHDNVQTHAHAELFVFGVIQAVPPIPRAQSDRYHSVQMAASE